MMWAPTAYPGNNTWFMGLPAAGTLEIGPLCACSHRLFKEHTGHWTLKQE